MTKSTATSAHTAELEARLAQLEAENRALKDHAQEEVFLREHMTREAIRQMRKKVTDPLTGLYNKSHIGFLTEAYSAAFGTYGMVNIDADDFSQINNTHDHLAGDAAIGAIADRLSHIFKRNKEVIGRVGGDEFWVLLPSIDENMEDYIYEQVDRYINQTPLCIDQIRGYLALQGHRNTDQYNLKNGMTQLEIKVSATPMVKKKEESNLGFLQRSETGLYDTKRFRKELGLREGRRSGDATQ